MSYVDAHWDRENDIVHVVERTSFGRKFINYPAKYIFYYPDPKGKYRSIYDTPLSKVSCKSWKEFKKEQNIYSSHKLFESDINPIYRILSENYLNIDAPKLQVAFFDIETDIQPFAVPSQTMVNVRNINDKKETKMTVFSLSQIYDKENYEVKRNKWMSIPDSGYLEPGPGYAPTDNPFMPITSISIHLQWLDTLVCLSVPPKSMSIDEAYELIDGIPNTFLYESEDEMLDAFLTLIEDADVLSGWNSEGYDIPYTINRVAKVLGKEATKRFCLWGHYPKKREYEKFGKISSTYDLVGRIHLDSLELYRKYTYEERHSYRLDAIGEIEVGENKVPYDGTLDQLYNIDFRKFIEYNIQDTALLNKLDQKLHHIHQSNLVAHGATVLIPATMGSVAVIDQSIVNEAHRHNLIMPARAAKNDNKQDTQAAGAYVAYPKKGIHRDIGSMDINSLYPSTIRALNMSPETIIGQIRQDLTDAEIAAKMKEGHSFAAAWEGKFECTEYELVMSRDTTTELTIDWADGTHSVMTGDQIYDLIFHGGKPWVMTANATFFTYEKEGIIPGLLAKWYAERKLLQAELKAVIDIKMGIELGQDLLNELA